MNLIITETEPKSEYFLMINFLKFTYGDTEKKFFDEKGIKNILPEKAPQLYLKRAVFCPQIKTILASVHITAKMCEGHFDFFPMLPLAILAQSACQAGALLTFLVANNEYPENIPLVYCAHETKIIGKNFMVPGDALLMVATYLNCKMKFHFVKIDVYKGMKKVAMIKQADYILVNKEHFRF